MDFLEKAARNEKSAHAYLFTGPSGVGKFLLAKSFANALIAGTEVRENIGKKEELDCETLFPRSENVRGVVKQRDIAVDDLRQALSRLGLYPHSGRKRVLIINDAHKLGTGAQNALLKTLEEPSSTAIIILVTCREEKILPTIHSRCQAVRFTLCRSEELAGEGNKEAADLALGRPGRFVRLKEDAQYLAEQKKLWEDIASIQKASLRDKLAFAERLGADAPQALEALEMWSWMVWSKERNKEGAYVLLGEIEQTRKIISSTNANAKLALEALFIKV